MLPEMRTGRRAIIESSVSDPRCWDIVFDDGKPDGTFRKLMDSTRLETLGWKARIDLKQGLQQAYADYLNK